MNQLLPVSNPEGTDSEMLEHLRSETFNYFRHEVNPRNGLIADKTQPGSPSSIAAVGMGLSVYVVAVERNLLSRAEAVERTLTLLRFFHSSRQGPEADATGYKGFYYHFLDMKTGRRAWQCELSTIDTAIFMAGVLAAAKELRERSFGAATAKYRELGTMANLLAFNAISALPTRNFAAATFEGAPALAAEEIAELRQVARSSCASCSIGCEHLYKGPGGKKTRMEYENVFALGPLCGVSDADAVIAASARCDELGLDTISTGGTIAWAMECAEKGLIDAPWLRFGDATALLRAIDEIGAREGLGDLLAEGSRSLAIAIALDRSNAFTIAAGSQG